jgi:lysine biosynthesis protein LysW
MKKITCLECQNQIELEDRNYVVGEIIECPFCGTELEVIEVREDGTVIVEIIEEEK